MKALDKLKDLNSEGKYICVGLDTDINKIPHYLLNEKDPVLSFNKQIIESTSRHAAAYKINFAFYENLGSEGYIKLENTLKLLPSNVLTIGDAKRGDIGNTSEKYAESIFTNFKFDASTLSPYMGFDSLVPFLNYTDKINFILALTSNPGSLDFQKLRLNNGDYLFQDVIKKVNNWNKERNCGIVFGATHIEELQNNINIFSNLPVLIPGIGTQGGDLHKVVKIFKSAGRKEYLINISRAILYADNSTLFADKAEEEIKLLNQQIINL